MLNCELEGAGAVEIAAPEGAVLRSNQTGCVVFVGEGSDPGDAEFVAQWGAVPADAESAEQFIQGSGMLGDFETLETEELSFLGAPATVSHVMAPSPPGVGEPREGWFAWASRGSANVLAIALCRPDNPDCRSSAATMFAESR